MCKPAPRVVVAAVYDADVPPDRPLNDIAQDRRRRLPERLRAEWIGGAEEEWRRQTGRPMTAQELERVLRRYPGDI